MSAYRSSAQKSVYNQVIDDFSEFEGNSMIIDSSINSQAVHGDREDMG